MRGRPTSPRLLLHYLVLISTLLSACATMRNYPDPPLDPTRVCRLTPNFESSFLVQLDSVDGQVLRWYQASAELLPGRHTVSATAAAPMVRGDARATHTLVFDAEAGHDYTLDADWYVYGLRLWIEEVSSGERIAEAVTPPPARPPVGAYR